MKLNAWLIGICFLFPFNICLSTLAQNECEAEKVYANISIEDREVLEHFFRNLLFYQGFAYTLFGDKPISIEVFDLDNPKKPSLFRYSCQGCKTWEKYVPFLPKNNFIFLFCEYPEHDFCEISLINKRAFYQVVKEHQKEFRSFLGTNDAEEVLQLLIQKQSLWNTPLKNRDDLIGLLLGYGKNNPQLFQKRREIRGIELKKKRTTPSPGYASVEEELKALNASLKSFSSEEKFTLNYLRLPGFVVDQSLPETNLLKKKYIKQRKFITEQYAKKNLLEVTLKRLCSPQDPQ
jgi:hypothetical protein